MEKAYISPRTSTADLCGLIFAVCAILLRRAYICTLAALKAAAKWLKTRHNFTPGDDDGEPVIMTGYQYIFFGVVACLVFLALSIKID